MLDKMTLLAALCLLLYISNVYSLNRQTKNYNQSYVGLLAKIVKVNEQRIKVMKKMNHLQSQQFLRLLSNHEITPPFLLLISLDSKPQYSSQWRRPQGYSGRSLHAEPERSPILTNFEPSAQNNLNGQTPQVDLVVSPENSISKVPLKTEGSPLDSLVHDDKEFDDVDLDIDDLVKLRSRWRSKCDKAAAKQCKKACKKALKWSCDGEFKCKRGLKKAFKRNCKRNCRSRFIDD